MNNTIPHFIAEKYAAGVMRGGMDAVTMFMDISGFTPMTAALVKNGREGNEVLSSILNRIFTPVIDAIYESGGFVSVFAGDAMSVIFAFDENAGSETTFDNSIGCAFKIKKIFEAAGVQNTRFGVFNLTVKIGMSFGEVNWRIIENNIRNSYYFSGAAVSGCAVCEHQCAPGEIVFDWNLYQKLNGKITLREKSSGYYIADHGSAVSETIKKADRVPSISPGIIEKFTPRTIINITARGEFRDIVSCFISFSQQGDIPAGINDITALAHDYGGYFACVDFADKAGVILVLFGAPSGREKLFERAVFFSRDLTEAAKNRALFPVRIGLTFGTAFTGFVGSDKRSEYTALGSVVNLAARLAMSAGFGEILMAPEFFENIKKTVAASGPVGMRFKGIEETVPVYKLSGLKVSRRVMDPEPENSISDKFIGREAELEEILKYLHPLEKKKFGGIICVNGAAGSGKTRFVNELKNKLAAGYSWFHMPCDQILRKSFNPFIHFLKDRFGQTAGPDRGSFENKLEELIRKTADREIADELVRTASFLGALLGLAWKNSLFESSDARTRYINTQYAVKNFIRAECAIKPVIIEIDDGHFIDRDSLALLKILTRNAEDVPFVIISECRYNDDGSNFSFGVKDVLEKRISINSFDAAASRLFVESLINKTGTVLPEKTLGFIMERSGGNPFYIGQITIYLKESGLVDDNFVLIPGHFEIPAGINSIIVARLDRLAADLKETVRTASVLGQVFAVNILLSMLDKLNIADKPGFEKCLSEGEKQLLWETLSEFKYIFKHSLIRESIYSMQLKERLRILHRTAGEVIERLHGGDSAQYYPELANHFENAEVYDKARNYIEKAAKTAADNYQNDLAVSYYDRLLNILSFEQVRKHNNDGRDVHYSDARENGRDRNERNEGNGRNDRRELEKTRPAREIIVNKEDILFKKGSIFEVTGDWDKADAAFREALKLSLRLRDKRLVAKNYLFIGVICSSKGNFKPAMRYLHRALKIFEALRDMQGVSKVAGHMAYIHLSVCEFDRAIERFNQKLKICRRRKDNLGISHAVGNLGIIHFRLGKNDLAMKCYEKQLQISGKIGDKRTVSAAIGNMGTVHLVKGEYDLAVKCYARQKKIAVQLGNRSSVGVAVGNIGAICFMKGRYKRSLSYFEEHLKISREIGDKYGMAISTGNIGEVHRILKDFAKSEEYLNEAIRIKKEINALYYLCNSLFAKAELFYDMKKIDESKKLCCEAMEVAMEARNEEQIFRIKLLDARIKFEYSKNIKDKDAAVEILRKMLAGEKNEEYIAALNYELYKMHAGTPVAELNNKRYKPASATACSDDGKTKARYKKNALALYKKLYSKTPNAEYLQRLREIEKDTRG